MRFGVFAPKKELLDEDIGHALHAPEKNEAGGKAFKNKDHENGHDVHHFGLGGVGGDRGHFLLQECTQPHENGKDPIRIGNR